MSTAVIHSNRLVQNDRSGCNAYESRVLSKLVARFMGPAIYVQFEVKML